MLTLMSPAPHAHDLPHLPLWGPYGKVYAGASHLPELASGLRCDLSVVSGFYRGRHEVPNVLWESGYRPAGAAPDLSWWRFEHRLDGAAVRLDADYAAYACAGASGVALRLRGVNRMPHAQNFSASLVLGAQYPARTLGDVCATVPERLRPGVVACPAGGAWCSALAYERKHPAVAHPWDTLQYDGGRWREFAMHGLVDGRGTYLEDPGDALDLVLTIPAALAVARVQVRARLVGGGQATLAVSGALEGQAVVRDPMCTGSWQVVEVGGGALPAGPARIRLRHAGPRRRVDLDVVAIVPAGTAIVVAERTWNPVPVLSPGPVPDSLMVVWPDLPGAYGLRWFAERSRVRQWYADRLDLALRERNHDHVSQELRGRGDGHWTEVLIEPLPAAPDSTVEAWATLVHGTGEQVLAALAATTPELLAQARRAGRARAARLPCLPAGERHQAGAEAMAACTLTNVTYPVRTRGGWIRHYSPGKWWDSLYTWDAGFVGLGLLECAPASAWACLAQYLMPEGDEDCAFLEHGTPLPVQIYLAQALWNRTRDRQALARVFPGLRQMHRFLVGRYGSSDTARLPSGLLSTFSYFYNSGGWDDYPPQVFVHANGLARQTAPAANTSHAIRCARILAGLAAILDQPAEEFAADATRLAAALQRHAWDAAEGVFSYVVHSPLRHPASGTNFNHGLDGVYPLITGTCTPAQEELLLARLADEGDLLAPCGLTAVSQRAAYYRADGYWNGTVWFAHNWFFWRTALDLGQADLAWSIAGRGLEAWTREVGISGNCYEHFANLGGRGAGWHHFSSLSSPVLAWHSAYFRPGLVTGGHQCWVLEQRELPGGGLAARLHLDGAAGRSSCVLATVAPGPRRIRWAGADCPARERHPGCWEITLPAAATGDLEILPV